MCDDDNVDADLANLNTLRESALVECYNIKFALEFAAGRGVYTNRCHDDTVEEAKHAFSSLPQRDEKDIDPVTLHNQALLNDDDGLDKLNFLLSHPLAPVETFGT